MGFLTSWFTGLLAAINLIVWLLLIGAALGAACALIGKFIKGLTGVGIAAAAGAVIVLGLHWTGAIDRLVAGKAQAEIALLEAEKAKAEHDLAALQDVRDYEQQQSQHQAEQLAESQALYAKVVEAIEKHKDDGSCPIAAFEDEIKAIGEMK